MTRNRPSSNYSPPQIRVVSISLKGTTARQGQVRTRIGLIDSAVQEIRQRGWKAIEALVLPGGCFYHSIDISGMDNQHRKESMDATDYGASLKTWCRLLNRQSPRVMIAAGVDGPNSSQFCVAWQGSGIVGIARKIFPTANESARGFRCYAEDFSSSGRVVQLHSGRPAVLCSCYDMFGLTETPLNMGKRSACIHRIIRNGREHLGDQSFRDLRLQCIQRWDLLVRTLRPSVAIAAIHHFDRPGLDGFWQRHGIATASAALAGGLAVGAANFEQSLPAIARSTLAANAVPRTHLEKAGHRRAHRLSPLDGFSIGEDALIRLFEG